MSALQTKIRRQVSRAFDLKEELAMFKSLRHRFIMTAMIAVFIVLAAITALINILNYQRVVSNADQVLNILISNEGHFPEDGGKGGQTEDGSTVQTEDGSQVQIEDQSQVQPDMEDADQAEGADGARPDLAYDGSADAEPVPNGDGEEDSQPQPIQPKKGNDLQKMSPETPFESRFFVAVYDEDENCVFLMLDNIAAVDEDDAKEYSGTVLDKKRDKGFIGDYRYCRQVEDDGQTMIVFLDCNRSLTSFWEFLKISLGVDALGFLSILVLVIIFSGRIIRPAEESYEKQKRFITDAGHELKTPLTIIDADITVLELDTGSSEWIDDVRVQTSRLTQLTNDLVFLSKMDEGQTRLNMIDFPISDVVSEYAQSFRALAITENKAFTSDITPMLEYTGDVKAIGKMISVLLDNALKYSAAGGWVSVSLKKTTKGLELKVANSTEDLKPEEIGHLFERFYRTDQSHNSGTGGYGLGLSIAKAVVNNHKGKITATQTEPSSLTITAVLPYNLKRITIASSDED